MGAGCADGAFVPDANSPRDFGVPDAETPTPDAAQSAPDAGVPPRPWTARVIYFTLTDRFWNGDPANDNRGVPDCFDPATPKLFHGGDFAGLLQHAGYLTDLGMGALWITPPYLQALCGSHGYWADFVVPDDGAIEPKLGDPAELTALISALHARDIRFLFDMIVNHSGRTTARILAQKPGWFHPVPGCETLGNPEIYCPLSTLPDFAQELPEVADYLDGVSRGWAQRFAIDGVRLDTAKHVLPAYLRDRFIPALRSVRPDLFLLAEVFSEGSAQDLDPVLSLGFDSAFQFPLRRALLQSLAQGGSLDSVAQQLKGAVDLFGQARTRKLVVFLDNHDVPRFLSDMTAPESEHVGRYRLALLALFAVPGIPQIYAGDELGAFGRAPDNRRDMPAWAFDEVGRKQPHAGYLDVPDTWYQLVKRLAALRTTLPALSDGDYIELWRPNGGQNLLAFLRSTSTSRALVVFNGGTTPHSIRIPIHAHPGVSAADKAAFAEGASLIEVAGTGAPATARIDKGALVVDLPPLTGGIYR